MNNKHDWKKFYQNDESGAVWEVTRCAKCGEGLTQKGYFALTCEEVVVQKILEA